ncbi:MAG: class I SAM-dependent methyltransferase [Acidimicrobiales bacterium]
MVAADGSSPAARAWAASLQEWALPEEILASARESPWGFPTELFAVPEVLSDTPSRRRALEVLPPGGSVLDVGAGGGAASLALVPPAGSVVGVDQSREMLGAFAAAARERHVPWVTVLGSWPEAAPGTDPADVVVCHHVLYNVPAIAPFLQALTDHAKDRVVVEVTAVHPQASLNLLWQRFWGLPRPGGPTAEDALAVARELGLDAGMERFERPPRGAHLALEARVAFVRRRLCLSEEADGEVARLLEEAGPEEPTATVCLWWGGRAPRP